MITPILQGQTTLTLDLLTAAPLSADPSTWAIMNVEGYRSCTVAYAPVTDGPAVSGGLAEFQFAPADYGTGTFAVGWGLRLNGIGLAFGTFGPGQPTALVGVCDPLVQLALQLQSQ